MKLQRQELKSLIKWLNKPNRKPLVIRGARQVGKSTLVGLLAKHTGRYCLTLNFERNPELAEFFKQKDPLKIINELSIYFRTKLDSSTTIVFLDEIQATPKVLAVLRYFYEEYPQMPVIAAGSLLDFELEQLEFSMPVGRIEYFFMGPLAFEDFLLAMGEHSLVDWLNSVSVHDKIPLPMHQKCMDLVKQYWLIGGMPEVVTHYAKYKDFQEIDNIKQNILLTYQDDFHKYKKNIKLPLLRQTFTTLPRLVGQKIKYANIDANCKSLEVKNSIQALNLAGIIHLVKHTSANGVPLAAQSCAKIFKTIFLDIGLQCSALRLNELDIIKGPEWAWINRGSLAEQFVGQSLLNLQSSYLPFELFYWVREGALAKAEVDYVLQLQNRIIPLEVKAGKTGSLKSLQFFVKEKGSNFAVRINADTPSLIDAKAKLTNNSGDVSYKLLSIPFYLVSQLKRLCNECDS